MDTKPLYASLTTLSVKLEKNISKANMAAALLVQGQAKNNIQRGTRNGSFYRRRSIIHQASSPGEYPKTDTGRLVSSINVEVNNNAAFVGSNLQYAAYLEQGTIYMEPRPWLYRSYRENIDKIEGLYNAAIRNSLNDTSI